MHKLLLENGLALQGYYFDQCHAECPTFKIESSWLTNKLCNSTIKFLVVKYTIES